MGFAALTLPCALEAARLDTEGLIAATDEWLNNRVYFLPGLGDVGDRILNTPEGCDETVRSDRVICSNSPGYFYESGIEPLAIVNHYFSVHPHVFQL